MQLFSSEACAAGETKSVGRVGVCSATPTSHLGLFQLGHVTHEKLQQQAK